MNIQTVIAKHDANFTPAHRVNQALTASAEKHVLQWMAAAQKHALGYERQRMARSLRDAIGRFWPDSLPMQFEG